jgi:hypothetical protein
MIFVWVIDDYKGRLRVDARDRQCMQSRDIVLHAVQDTTDRCRLPLMLIDRQEAVANCARIEPRNGV